MEMGRGMRPMGAYRRGRPREGEGMDDKAIEREIAIGKVEQAFGLFIDNFAACDPSKDRGDIAGCASEYFAGMIAGIVLDREASAEEISKAAAPRLGIVSVANITRSEHFIREMVSKVTEIRG